ncbi:hypothetical protein C8R45DRAFT_943680 [Mycena sanguinolenta]|nr:hypothetical protein C8R45DRAFT_943680 [Mycena sanguinolenta]
MFDARHVFNTGVAAALFLLALCTERGFASCLRSSIFKSDLGARRALKWLCEAALDAKNCVWLPEAFHETQHFAGTTMAVQPGYGHRYAFCESEWSKLAADGKRVKNLTYSQNLRHWQASSRSQGHDAEPKITFPRRNRTTKAAKDEWATTTYSIRQTLDSLILLQMALASAQKERTKRPRDQLVLAMFSVKRDAAFVKMRDSAFEAGLLNPGGWSVRTNAREVMIVMPI